MKRCWEHSLPITDSWYLESGSASLVRPELPRTVRQRTREGVLALAGSSLLEEEVEVVEEEVYIEIEH